MSLVMLQLCVDKYTASSSRIADVILKGSPSSSHRLAACDTIEMSTTHH